MIEASGGAERAEMERRLVERSLEEELGTTLPAQVRVVTVEETAQTIYLALPPATEQGSVELCERELETVAGAGSCDSCLYVEGGGQWC